MVSTLFLRCATHGWVVAENHDFFTSSLEYGPEALL